MGERQWARGPERFSNMMGENIAVRIIYTILVKLHKYFCNVNSKQGLAKWLHAFISLPDIVKLSFQKVTPLFAFKAMHEHSFSNPSSSIQRKNVVSFNFLIELLAICMAEIISSIAFLNFFYYQLGFTPPLFSSNLCSFF